MYQRISVEEYETIILAIKNEIAFIRRMDGEYPLEELEKLVDQLSGVDEVTTPFNSIESRLESDNLRTEDNYQYLRELSRDLDSLGEVHDTFNVEITQGNGNKITLTREVVRSSQDDGSYLQSMVDVLSKLRN